VHDEFLRGVSRGLLAALVYALLAADEIASRDAGAAKRVYFVSAASVAVSTG